MVLFYGEVTFRLCEELVELTGDVLLLACVALAVELLFGETGKDELVFLMILTGVAMIVLLATTTF